MTDENSGSGSLDKRASKSKIDNDDGFLADKSKKSDGQTQSGDQSGDRGETEKSE